MENYHNTTSLNGQELEEAQSNATGQDKILLDWFEKNQEMEVTADELWINLFDADSVPITSVRRSLNTLRDKMEKIENIPDQENAGKPKKKKGVVYGKKIFIWRYKKPTDEAQLELNL